MTGDISQDGDAEHQAERRRRALTLAIEAMVTARHEEIMETLGLPRDTFEPAAVEVLEPEAGSWRAARAAAASARRGPAVGVDADSVLRGGRRRAIGR